MKVSPEYGELNYRWHRHAHTRHNFSGNVEDNLRAVYGWSATPLQWILQYWTPVEWTPVGVGVEWSEPSPTPVLQWTPRLNLG
jgi:hypothetical protein